jgi:integrase
MDDDLGILLRFKLVLSCLRVGEIEALRWEDYYDGEIHVSRSRWNGLGSNLNHLGVDDSVIQRILRHSNLTTTQTYYIKPVSSDLRGAMAKLENSIPKPQLDTNWTLKLASTKPM